jgi:hypothetical protein
MGFAEARWTNPLNSQGVPPCDREHSAPFVATGESVGPNKDHEICYAVCNLGSEKR